MKEQIDLKSTVGIMGKAVTQEIYFSRGNIRTIENIDTAMIEQGVYTCLDTDKARWEITTLHVDYVKIKPLEKTFIEGPTETRILHFSGGRKETIHNVLVSSIKRGEFIKFMTSNGCMYLVSNVNLDCTEIIKQ